MKEIKKMKMIADFLMTTELPNLNLKMKM